MNLLSSDGEARGTSIQVGATGCILRRPVQALYHLEICASHPAQFTVNEPTKDTPDEHVHPLRKAAQNAQELS